MYQTLVYIGIVNRQNFLQILR